MKIMKYVFAIFAIFLAANVNAQFRFGVKGGVNIASVKFSKDIIDSKNITGFHIGPEVELMTPTGLGLDVAVLYTQKGFGANDENVRNDFIEVPVSLKWKLQLPLVKPFAAVGPYFGFRVGGDKIWKEIDNITGQIETKSFNTGLNLGVGAEILSSFQVGINYGFGFTDNYKYEDLNVKSSSGKNRTWSISAAVFF